MKLNHKKTNPRSGSHDVHVTTQPTSPNRTCPSSNDHLTPAASSPSAYTSQSFQTPSRRSETHAPRLSGQFNAPTDIEMERAKSNTSKRRAIATRDRGSLSSSSSSSRKTDSIVSGVKLWGSVMKGLVRR